MSVRESGSSGFRCVAAVVCCCLAVQWVRKIVQGLQGCNGEGWR